MKFKVTLVKEIVMEAQVDAEDEDAALGIVRQDLWDEDFTIKASREEVVAIEEVSGASTAENE